MSANFLQANTNTTFWSGSVKYAAFNELSRPVLSLKMHVVCDFGFRMGRHDDATVAGRILAIGLRS